MALIAVDFDNTINDNESIEIGERYSKPYPKAKETLQKMIDDGHKILIFSCNRKAWIQEWMTHWKIPYTYIWEGEKPVADVYIDDRAVRFRGSWTDALTDTLSMIKEYE